MKIMLVSGTDSGVLRGRSELINALLEENNKVIVATPAESGHEKLEEMGCTFLEISLNRHGKNPFNDYGLFRKYIEIIKKAKPDVVLTFTTKPNVYCGIACRKLNIPVIMNITGMGSALGNGGFLQKVLICFYKCACNGKNIKKIFFQNDDSMEFFKRNRIGNPESFKRIPGSGVNLNKFSVQPFPHSDTVDFLFVARVMKAKGIEEYIEAARNVRISHPEAVFHVLGGCDEEYKERLEEEMKKGNIVYHGRVNNIPDYEKKSQCTIHPSYYPEGMSNVILEAAASGRPVITTDHPGCRDGVDDGVTGFIVPIKNASALTEAVNKFLEMPIEERVIMGLHGREKMEREFDRKFVSEAYISEIRE